LQLSRRSNINCVLRVTLSACSQIGQQSVPNQTGLSRPHGGSVCTGLGAPSLLRCLRVHNLQDRCISSSILQVHTRISGPSCNAFCYLPTPNPLNRASNPSSSVSCQQDTGTAIGHGARSEQVGMQIGRVHGNQVGQALMLNILWQLRREMRQSVPAHCQTDQGGAVPKER